MTMPPQDEPMSEAQIERWLNTRRAKKPLARNYSMLDGFLTAMAAGPLDLEHFPFSLHRIRRRRSS